MPSGLFRAEADPSQAKAAGQQSRLGSISRSRTGLGRVASHRWRYGRHPGGNVPPEPALSAPDGWKAEHCDGIGRR